MITHLYVKRIGSVKLTSNSISMKYLSKFWKSFNDIFTTYCNPRKWLFSFYVFIVLISRKSCVWYCILAMCRIQQNDGTFIINGHQDAWKNFSYRVIGKQNLAWNTLLSATDITPWCHNHKLVRCCFY